MRRIALGFLLAVPAFLYGSSPSQLAPQDAIETQVQHKLNTLAYYTVFDDLHFTVEGGKVILSGEVMKPLLKIDAEAAVKEVKGVSGVENRIEVLPINLDHILRIESLAMYHRDPFDRVLIAQSIEEKLPLITADPQFERYPVEVIW